MELQVDDSAPQILSRCKLLSLQSVGSVAVRWLL